MVRRLASTLTATAVAAVLLVAPTSPALAADTAVAPGQSLSSAAAASAAAPFTASQRENNTLQLLDRLNATRAAKKKTPLTLHRGVTAVAQAWANKMASGAVRFQHNPNVASQVPGGWSSLGENIAMRSNNDLAALHQQWVTSPSHYANMVGSCTHVGIAVARASNGSIWAVQVFATYPTKARPYTAAQSTSASNQVASTITRLRATKNKPALVRSAKLTSQAQTWANRMALAVGNKGKPNYAASFPRRYTAATQAYAVSSVSSPAGAAAALRKAHGAKLVAGYTHAGIGVARAVDGKVYVIALMAKYPSSVRPG